ncbi:hypothetical protein NP233_g10977 [Leucocoprinus birnbaumii]|uniref:Uncharacterized protein n=1 Tax=Leucocoprinus birnbaumii TaxID=56174 RepID=A0AAD5YPD0_9AGAR|nr:hypothetical protein NP233_g10977 [Leucocoprinus birnbaumii]
MKTVLIVAPLFHLIQELACDLLLVFLVTAAKVLSLSRVIFVHAPVCKYTTQAGAHGIIASIQVLCDHGYAFLKRRDQGLKFRMPVFMPKGPPKPGDFELRPTLDVDWDVLSPREKEVLRDDHVKDLVLTDLVLAENGVEVDDLDLALHSQVNVVFQLYYSGEGYGDSFYALLRRITVVT